MTAPADPSMSAPFPDLWAKDRHGHTIACPCLSLTIYLDETDPAQILDFYQRAYEALKPHLTHYLAEEMRHPGKITSRGLGMVPTWLKRPNEDHEYHIWFWGGELTDISPWNIEILLNYIAADPARRERYPGFLANFEKRRNDGQPRIPCTVLRVSVPVDADLAKPEVWIPWVLGFDSLRDGEFMLGESSYSMNVWENEGVGFGYAACSRYPGLDWFDTYHGKFLRRYEPSLHAVLPQVKRAAWLTFLGEVPVRFLGGVDKIRAEFADEPRIVLHPVAHGLGIQAGPGPELGDLSRHELIPLQRRVARVLRPVRLKSVPLAFEAEFVRHWFNMFDDENPMYRDEIPGAPK
jgi:Protein of unknown function (DUF3396)